MSINKIDSPTAYTPGYLVGQTDYTQQNLKTEAALAMGQNIFADFTSTSTTVKLKQGAFIYFGGSIYQVQDEDYTVTGTPIAGVNYIKISGTDTLAAEIIQTVTSYVWDSANQGLYSGSDMILPLALFYDGTNITRGFLMNRSFVTAYVTSDGIIKLDGGSLDTGGGYVYTAGGDISSDGGKLDTGGGVVYTAGGDISSANGDIKTGSGDFDNETGHFLPCSSPTTGTVSVDNYEVASIAIGNYIIYSTLSLQVYINGSWRTVTSTAPAYISSNGSNVQVANVSGSTASFYYIKY